MTKTLPRFCLLSVVFTAALPTQGRDLADLDLSVHQSDIEPSVTLREHENQTVQEYRVNNNLYMVKITPSVGAPYYLVDEDGSGDLAWHRGAGQFEDNVPQWALLSW